MGSGDSKLNFRSAVVRLGEDTPLNEGDSYWSEFWKYSLSVDDIYALTPCCDIQKVVATNPANICILCHKLVGKLKNISSQGVGESPENILTVLNCIRILTRILPFLFEESAGGISHEIFWTLKPLKSYFPPSQTTSANIPLEEESSLREYLGVTLLNCLADLCFLPNFTITAEIEHLNLKTLDTREFIWFPGIGSEKSQDTTGDIDSNRKEVLKLLLCCFSQTLYLKSCDLVEGSNPWLSYFTSGRCKSRHLLPLFCSLLNVVFAYDPVGYGLPYQYFMWNDFREPLVEVSLSVLVCLLDYHFVPPSGGEFSVPDSGNSALESVESCAESSLSSSPFPVGNPSYPSCHPQPQFHGVENVFLNYLMRLHRSEDFQFIENGLSLLVNNPFLGTFLPGSQKKITFHQELFIFFWKFLLSSRPFLHHILRSSKVLEIITPLLYHLVHARKDSSMFGLIHVGVFILLLLSGERSFGVRLNSAFDLDNFDFDLPPFTGTFADLLILSCYRVISAGSESLESLYDCMLTILVNISPYIKSLSMTTCSKITLLFEMFSNPCYLLSARDHHHFLFFLLEFFNNIIQYQFDGNANLIYMMIRNRAPFEKLALMPNDPIQILHQHGTKSALRQASMLSVHLATLKQPFSAALKPADAGSSGGINPCIEAGEEANVGKHSRSFEPDCGETCGLGESIAEIRKPSEGSEKGDFSGENLEGANVGFVPSTEWVQSWKEKLPLETVLRLLQVLVPQVEQLCIEKSVSDDSTIIEFLKHGTLVGLLPVPHPILIRKYQSSSATEKWLSSYMWGVIFLRHNNPPLWYGTQIQLFQIRRSL